MTDQVLFDKLIYIDRLKRAGISEDQARAYAEAMDEALREAVVTKTDLRLMAADLRNAITDVKADVTVLRGNIYVNYAVLAVVALTALRVFWPHG